MDSEKPLTDLTKKNGFLWTEEAQSAFEKLKLALTIVPGLRLPDFYEPFTVKCDASSAGVGAILLQSENRDTVYWAGIFVKTNHFSLKHLLAQQVMTSGQHRLLMKLFPFDFTIIYKSGKKNQRVDALSKRPQHADFMALVLSVNMDFLNLYEALLNDLYTQNIITSISQDPTTHPEFTLSDSKLFYHNCLVILDDLSLRKKLFSECHDSLTRGHRGYLKTLKRLTKNFFWPQMKRDVKTHVQNCMVCQQNKYQTLAPADLLQPLTIPNHVWEDISLDFIIEGPNQEVST
nr:hypothetical protein [Tanacetum cinerariifolium]